MELIKPVKSHRTRSAKKACPSSLIIAITVGLSMLFSLSTKAEVADNWNVEGANGVLKLQGILTESACRLDMSSAYQDISLGEIGTGRLQRVGDRGVPTAFQLRLRDCVRTAGSSLDERSGVMSWDASQPLVSISFVAQADINSPQLVKAHGVSGLGLHITDSQGRDVSLGFRGKPQFLTPGQDTLTYFVTPERTAAPLKAGAYRSQVDFRLNYD
ncbi:fimbrial protein [Serratia inhibens]|uniref:fimbrial protein n=1 Tax=Serratia inhibens TaxID=2338073 RepID=UPI000809749C|nr:putative major fimbrial subunit LpfA [Serratia inhibens PRI-2C]